MSSVLKDQIFDLIKLCYWLILWLLLCFGYNYFYFISFMSFLIKIVIVRRAFESHHITCCGVCSCPTQFSPFIYINDSKRACKSKRDKTRASPDKLIRTGLKHGMCVSLPRIRMNYITRLSEHNIYKWFYLVDRMSLSIWLSL